MSNLDLVYRSGIDDSDFNAKLKRMEAANGRTMGRIGRQIEASTANARRFASALTSTVGIATGLLGVFSLLAGAVVGIVGGIRALNDRLSATKRLSTEAAAALSGGRMAASGLGRTAGLIGDRQSRLAEVRGQGADAIEAIYREFPQLRRVPLNDTPSVPNDGMIGSYMQYAFGADSQRPLSDTEQTAFNQIRRITARQREAAAAVNREFDQREAAEREQEMLRRVQRERSIADRLGQSEIQRLVAADDPFGAQRLTEQMRYTQVLREIADLRKEDANAAEQLAASEAALHQRRMANIEREMHLERARRAERQRDAGLRALDILGGSVGGTAGERLRAFTERQRTLREIENLDLPAPLRRLLSGVVGRRPLVGPAAAGGAGGADPTGTLTLGAGRSGFAASDRFARQVLGGSGANVAASASPVAATQSNTRATVDLSQVIVQLMRTIQDSTGQLRRGVPAVLGQ